MTHVNVHLQYLIPWQAYRLSTTCCQAPSMTTEELDNSRWEGEKFRCPSHVLSSSHIVWFLPEGLNRLLPLSTVGKVHPFDSGDTVTISHWTCCHQWWWADVATFKWALWCWKHIWNTWQSVNAQQCNVTGFHHRLLQDCSGNVVFHWPRKPL